MEQTTPITNPGKGKGVAGFVISLVAVVFWIFICTMAVAQATLAGGGYMTAGIWTAISVLGLLLSFMGMQAGRAVGAKTGLATAGLVLGIVAVLLCVWMFIGVNNAQKLHDGVLGGFDDLKDQMEKGLNNLVDSLKTMGDSIK